VLEISLVVNTVLHPTRTSFVALAVAPMPIIGEDVVRVLRDTR
jgi:hypothetical protein